MTDTTTDTTTETTDVDSAELAQTTQSSAFEYTDVTDLKYVDADQTLINANVTFSHLGTVPYTMSASDTEAHGIELWEKALAGDFGEITPYTATVTTLQEAQDAQTDLVTEDCETAVTGGFTSDALGETYTYPSKLTDQSNLQARVLSSILNASDASWTTMFWCEDADGNGAYRTHTAAQIQVAGQAGEATISAYLAKKAALIELIVAATTVADVQAITWDTEVS